VVGDAVLTVAIAELRKVLGDDPCTPRFIETVQRRGTGGSHRYALRRQRKVASSQCNVPLPHQFLASSLSPPLSLVAHQNSHNCTIGLLKW